MAKPFQRKAIAAARTGKPAWPRWAMSRFAKASLFTGLLAGANELGVKGALASTMLMIAAPVVVGGFVYEVSAMRQARLAYEARDRVAYAARIEAEARNPDDTNPTRRPVAKVDNPDMTGKLDAMLASRSIIIDTFGTDPAAVAPVYIRIIKQMLRDDDDALASLSSQRKTDAANYADALAEREARLREVHAKLTILAGV